MQNLIGERECLDVADGVIGTVSFGTISKENQQRSFCVKALKMRWLQLATVLSCRKIEIAFRSIEIVSGT